MVKYIILALVAIIVLSFFGYDLRAIIEAPQTQSNLHYAYGGIETVWNAVKGPIIYFYDKIFIGILWKAFIHNLGRIDAGAPTELENAATRLKNIGETGYTPLGQ
ncbi:MAG TPA: hypothetical protein VFQ72_00165 [Candidatus Paceibacterota bacterium]|nr:hypothetical protein [Candidatus Paceibacterota bacterium]